MTALLIVMYILAGAFILIGIVGGSGMQLEKFSIPIIPRIARIVALMFGTSFFMIALYFTVTIALRDPVFSGSPDSPIEKPPAQTVTVEPKPDKQSTTPRTRVIFSTPHNGDLVERKAKVTGTVLDLTPGEYLWIVVHSQRGSRYYPQAGPISVMSDDGFETDAFFGSPSDAGNTYSIIAAVTSQKDSDAFARYREDAKRANGYQGLATIPDSVFRAAQSTVIRR